MLCGSGKFQGVLSVSPAIFNVIFCVNFFIYLTSAPSSHKIFFILYYYTMKWIVHPEGENLKIMHYQKSFWYGENTCRISAVPKDTLLVNHLIFCDSCLLILTSYQWQFSHNCATVRFKHHPWWKQMALPEFMMW